MTTYRKDQRGVDGIALARLLTWMSPSFPVGAFSYSHGVEWAVEAGDVHDRHSLQNWLSAILNHGAGRSDAVMVSLAWRYVSEGDIDALVTLSQLGVALNPSQERHLETTAQGVAFLKAARAGWPMLDEADAILALSEGASNTSGKRSHPVASRGACPVPYPVAVGAVGGVMGVSEDAVLTAYLHGFLANLVSAGVRLIPLGQSDGIRVMAALEEVVVARAGWARSASLDDMGGFAPLSDIASMKHEDQYTRLFRS